MTVVAVVWLFLHFFDSQNWHDDGMPCTTYSVSSVFAHGDALNSSIGLTDQRGLWMNLFAIPRGHAYTILETRRKRVGWNQHNMRAETSIGEGSGETQKIFIFWGTRNAHFGTFSGQFEYSCLGCNTVLIRPTPAIRSVKKDRNGVPVVKKRTGTAFRCVPVPNEPCCPSVRPSVCDVGGSGPNLGN